MHESPIDEVVGASYAFWPPSVGTIDMTGSEAEHHRTPSRPLPADMRRAVANALAGGPASELERLVRDYVRALKDAGLAPEQALARVKASIAVAPPMPGRPESPAQHLANDVVQWFVAEYYRAD
jgi:hypothetical protein